jgi:hypothetical protein
MHSPEAPLRRGAFELHLVLARPKAGSKTLDNAQRSEKKAEAANLATLAAPTRE